MSNQNPARKANTTLFTLLPNEAVELDAVSFDNIIKHRGVKMVHHRAIPCPIGLTDENDIHRTHEDHSGCYNGYIYKPIGRCSVVFTSNTSDPRHTPEGMYDGSQAVVTFPRWYDSDPTKRILIRPIDMLALEEEDILVAIWDKKHRRNDGLPDRTEFPAVEVEHLVDANGNWWIQSVHFDLVNGDIVWRDGQGPSPGTVYSIWYQYRPRWYVSRLLHEIRLIPVPDYIDTNTVALERLSYGAIIEREYVYRNQKDDDQVTDRKRQRRPPDSPDPQDF